ncbi:hypothetical protein [Piscibacillus salipiscarius]|nr:hypothetical protein [Piscibacillus salipiscarius]
MNENGNALEDQFYLPVENFLNGHRWNRRFLVVVYNGSIIGYAYI